MYNLLIGFLLIVFVFVVIYVYKKNMHIWLYDYIYSNIYNFFTLPSKSNKTKDIMFLFVDHYELAGKSDRLSAWLNDYPTMVSKYRDFDGVKPQHTWFYALDLTNEEELKAIKPLVDEGFGEVELHWHHSHKSSQQFELDLKNGLEVFHKYGYMKSYNNSTHSSFSFIHGNWSLNNSRGEEFCGINNEIEILKKYGCYGDFTFPAMFSPAQPKYVNKITYTNLDTINKSYNHARISEVGKYETDDEFMIMQGPLAINFKDWRHKWHPTIENGDINGDFTQNSSKRIDCWIRQNIHVKNNPDWIFVKIFCHGAQDYKSLCSESTAQMYEYLGDKYNDGKKYRLHYVTARECYNIVKAAENGKTGNPNKYRDFIIPHPNKRDI